MAVLIRPLLRLALAAAITAGLAGAAGAGESFHWVQYVPGGIEGRAITDAPSCPAATIDGAAVAMNLRSGPGPNYPVRVCAVPIAAGAKLVTIDGIPLPLPIAHPNRILLIDDSGCRLKGKKVQDCNDAAMWPFRTGSDIATLMKPDLVLHVGDYHYRESACPPGNLGCAGAPFGDTWDVWRADFFSPAELLLDSAPWIFVRCNHEECDRGGKGWARILDPYPWSADAGRDGCLPGPAAPFTVDIGGVTIVVMDTSTADEEKANDQQAEVFRAQFQSVKNLAPSGTVWLAFHRAIWSTDGSVALGRGGDNKTLALAAKDNIPENVQAFLSGHQHKFEVDAYQQDLPVQIVSGHGGDDLSPDAPANPVGITVNGMTIVAGFAKPRTFGFSLLERDPSDRLGMWTITDYDTLGRSLGRCRIEGRSVDCQALP